LLWNVPGSSSAVRPGSHMILSLGNPFARVVVPDHRQVRQGTLRRIIADAGLTVDEFIGHLSR